MPNCLSYRAYPQLHLLALSVNHSIRGGLLGFFELAPVRSQWRFGRAGEAHFRTRVVTPAAR
jgi:hypothetical protein